MARIRTVIACVFLAALGLASCGGNDDDSCNGRILTNCNQCTCPTGEETVCTAFPKGDENSSQRCCECH